MSGQDDYAREELRYLREHIWSLHRRVAELERLLKKEEK